MRILIAAAPAAGHFNPLTGVALRLKQDGHDVRWYAGPDYGARARRLGIDVSPYRQATEITAENLNVLFPERANLSGPKAAAFDVNAFFFHEVRSQYHDIRDIRADFPYDALLMEGAFYAGYPVAKRLGVPVFVLGSIAAPTLRGEEAVTPAFGRRARQRVTWSIASRERCCSRGHAPAWRPSTAFCRRRASRP